MLSYSPITWSPSPTSSSSTAEPVSLLSSPPKPSSSPTTPLPTFPSTTPPSRTLTSSPPPPSPPTKSFLYHSLFGNGFPPSPSPPPATPSTPSGTQVRPPLTPVSTVSFCFPSSPSFFHCYCAKVFQFLLKRKGKNVPWVADLLLFPARSILNTLTMVKEPSTVR
ncbi:hypothetical protein V8G54_030784 [Vigna mungo]|uniref:Uncharacterized protein n=1 Tax=Vigna mungo TaxID=3915 RepID=A0AAQ3MX29_VIGMU